MRDMQPIIIAALCGLIIISGAMNIRNHLNSSNSKKINVNDEDSEEDNEYTIKNNYTDLEQLEPHKMVLCVNTSLQMGKGKMCAQCSHAAVGAYKLASSRRSSKLTALHIWENTGYRKITAKADDRAHLMELMSKAQSRGLVTCLIEDEGLTQIAHGSVTVLAIGPAPSSAFIGITDRLKLL